MNGGNALTKELEKFGEEVRRENSESPDVEVLEDVPGRTAIAPDTPLDPSERGVSMPGRPTSELPFEVMNRDDVRVI